MSTEIAPPGQATGAGGEQGKGKNEIKCVVIGYVTSCLGLGSICAVRVR